MSWFVVFFHLLSLLMGSSCFGFTLIFWVTFLLISFMIHEYVIIVEYYGMGMKDVTDKIDPTTVESRVRTTSLAHESLKQCLFENYAFDADSLEFTSTSLIDGDKHRNYYRIKVIDHSKCKKQQPISANSLKNQRDKCNEDVEYEFLVSQYPRFTFMNYLFFISEGLNDKNLRFELDNILNHHFKNANIVITPLLGPHGLLDQFKSNLLNLVGTLISSPPQSPLNVRSKEGKTFHYHNYEIIEINHQV